MAVWGLSRAGAGCGVARSSVESGPPNNHGKLTDRRDLDDYCTFLLGNPSVRFHGRWLRVRPELP